MQVSVLCGKGGAYAWCARSPNPSHVVHRVQSLEERGASESAAAGDEGGVMGVHADFSLPFRPETDSRHHFKTRTLVRA